LLKLGSLMRFVPKSVMTGFINAVAVLIVLGQLADLTGYAAAGPNRIVQTINLARNLNQVDLPSLFVGLMTIVLILVLEKTKLASFGIVVAMIVASLLPPLFDWGSVALASSIAIIPSELPRVTLPHLSTFLPMVVPALALALVGLVQGSGISQSYANPDGKYSDASGDFTGQGVANIAAGLLQGMPVGGSLSATSLVVNGGAKTRLANIVAGITMAVSLLLFGGLIGSLAMPALAGLLVVIGFRTLKPDDVRMVWNTGTIQAMVMVVTFTMAFFIPLHFAVLVGVALSIFLFAFQSSNRIVIKEWRHSPGEFPEETVAPTLLPSNKVTILVPYGSLFFASAQGFEVQLPAVSEETHNAAVILNLRGHADFGSTFLTVLQRYALELKARNSRLIDLFERQNIFTATDRIGEALFAAHAEANTWLEQNLEQRPPASS
jgi:SulP family sulfate permease